MQSSQPNSLPLHLRAVISDFSIPGGNPPKSPHLGLACPQAREAKPRVFPNPASPADDWDKEGRTGGAVQSRKPRATGSWSPPLGLRWTGPRDQGSRGPGMPQDHALSLAGGPARAHSPRGGWRERRSVVGAGGGELGSPYRGPPAPDHRGASGAQGRVGPHPPGLGPARSPPRAPRPAGPPARAAEQRRGWKEPRRPRAGGRAGPAHGRAHITGRRSSPRISRRRSVCGWSV